MKKAKMKQLSLLILFILIILSSRCNIIQNITISEVFVTEDHSIANIFTRHTVTGITTPLPQPPDVTGYIGVAYVTVGDINKDGTKDIVATSGVGADSDPITNDGSVALFTWDVSDLDSWTQTILNDTFAFPNETMLHDMDGDDDLDILVMDQFLLGISDAPSGIFYLENQGGTITSPSNWIKKTIYQDDPLYSYHRSYLLDVDGDSDEDIITTKINLSEKGTVLLLENTGSLPYTPHTISSGAGSLFALHDIDSDSDLDIVAPQFSITASLLSNEVLGGPNGDDPLGDSLIWLENPGIGPEVFNTWNYYTIDNWYTSSNPLGKGFEVILSDIDNDGTVELVVTNHNHQKYDGSGKRLWPSGVYLFEIPTDTTSPGNWLPVTIDTGDPSLEPTSGLAPYEDPVVLADVYAVNRRGSYYDQGSPGVVRSGDITGNGFPDLVVPGDGKGALYYYQNEGITGTSMNFKRATLYEDPQCMPGDAKIVDIDSDGDLDIVAVIFDTSVDNPPPPYTSSSIFIFRQN